MEDGEAGVAGERDQAARQDVVVLQPDPGDLVTVLCLSRVQDILNLG